MYCTAASLAVICFLLDLFCLFHYSFVFVSCNILKKKHMSFLKKWMKAFVAVFFVFYLICSFFICLTPGYEILRLLMTEIINMWKTQKLSTWEGLEQVARKKRSAPAEVKTSVSLSLERSKAIQMGHLLNATRITTNATRSRSCKKNMSKTLSTTTHKHRRLVSRKQETGKYL